MKVVVAQQCPSCKHVHMIVEVEEIEVFRYRSGKKKGKIKRVDRAVKAYMLGNPFIAVENDAPVTLKIAGLNYSSRGYECYSYRTVSEPLSPLICPQCGTIFSTEAKLGLQNFKLWYSKEITREESKEE